MEGSPPAFLVRRRRRLLALIVAGFGLCALTLFLGVLSYSDPPRRQKARPVPGYLLFRILPKDARVWLDGHPLPSVQRGRSLAVGRHQILVKAEGYQTHNASFQVHPEDATILRVTLRPLPVPVKIFSLPDGAAISINQKPLGRAPISRSLRPGWVRIRVSAPGYVPHQRDIQIVPRKKGQRFFVKLGGLARIRSRDKAPMRWVPGMYFARGSKTQDIHYAQRLCQKGGKGKCPAVWFTAEQPQRLTWVDAFWIDQHEVSRQQYMQCVKAGACRNPAYARAQASLPVVGVAWFDARAFCRWVGARLPRESEWELAAGGPKHRTFPWGARWEAKRANAGSFDAARQSARFDDSDGHRFEAPTGALSAGRSPFQVDDMAGNVAEWVVDCFHTSFYRDAPEKNPVHLPDACPSRVIRGGSWLSPPWELRTTHRLSLPPAERSTTVGFRCARSRWPQTKQGKKP